MNDLLLAFVIWIIGSVLAVSIVSGGQKRKHDPIDRKVIKRIDQHNRRQPRK